MGFRPPGGMSAADEARLLLVESAVVPQNVLTKTANFTAAAGDLILADATGGGFTITLPSGPPVGALVIVKKIDASVNAVAVAGTIDGDAGGASIAVQHFGVLVEHVGSDAWRVVGVTAANGDATAALEAHIADTADAHDASAISFAPTGSLAATDVQAAIAEAASEAAALGMPLALTGAAAATRYVGGTASVAPTTGTFAVGDFVVTQDGKVFVCTVAGSPGTWVQVGSGGGVTDTLAKTLTGTGVLQVGNTASTTAATGIQIGTDASANLYRIAAGSLKTDAGLHVAGSFRVSSGNFIALDAGFAVGFIIVGAGIATLTAALSVREGLRVSEGANKKQGVATLVGGTVTVNNTSITASSRIFLTAQSLGTVAVPMALAVTARSVGTSFTITSADATDTSVVAYEIFEPGN